MAAYPESCFFDLVGIKNTCSTYETIYWVDDVPGIDLSKLAMTAEASTGTGEKLGAKLIESAARIMAADVESIYDANYKVQNQLVGGCSTCKFTSNYSSGVAKGIIIKNNTTSAFSKILLDKLTVKLNSTGTFNIIITDDETSKTIEHEFVAGYEYDFINIKYITRKKQIRVYINESDALLNTLSCPRSSSGCGCSGNSAVVSDLVYSGLTAGVESQAAYGFLPCASIICEAADLLCFIAHSAPRMIGLALLYKTAEMFFDTTMHSLRNNKQIGAHETDKKEDVKKYQKLYLDKLNGNGTRGIKDIVFTTLSQSQDVCVICDAKIATSWATG